MVKIRHKHQKLVAFLTLSLLGLLLINITLIGAYIILTKYGSMTLDPGEKYTVNIPFSGTSNFPVICGKAEQSDGSALKNISVIIKYYNNETELARNTTGSDGKYCVTLPEITSSKKFDVYLEYDNETSEGDPLILGSNNYDLNFENYKVYSKSSDEYAFLIGNITNDDARVENGRFEAKVGYKDGTWKYIFGDYEKYLVNINPNEIYQLPNEEVNISWKIPSDAQLGEYKFLFKTSFNGVEKISQSIYFNITN